MIHDPFELVICIIFVAVGLFLGIKKIRKAVDWHKFKKNLYHD